MRPKIQNMTLVKADIVDAVYKEVGLSKKDSHQLVNKMLGHITDTLITGRPMKLAKFGKFTVSHKSERMGRNPKTGEAAIIPTRKVVTFKPSPYLSKRVDGELKNKKY
jgi:integration host factor subunit alpha